MVTVEEWLKDKGDAERSAKTLYGYRNIMQSYADFIGVPLDEVHNHLTGKNLRAYKMDRKKKGLSPAGIRTNLTVIGQFFKRNGAKLSDGESEVIRGKKVTEQHFKALSQETLQKMMARSNPHGRAILSMLVSTGMRSGEVSKLTIADIGRLDPNAKGGFVSDLQDGRVVRIRNEIAKGNTGGKVYLTTEARQYLSEWLAIRDAHISNYADRNRGLVAAGMSGKRPAKDYRLFAVGYESLQAMFKRLYRDVDGETVDTKREREVKDKKTGKVSIEKYKQNLITLHSTRRYFRTAGGDPGSIGVDMAEYLMRHHGYLNYRVFPDEVCEQAFHDAEKHFTIRTLTNGEARKELDKVKEQINTRDQEMEDMRKELAETRAMMDAFIKAHAEPRRDRVATVTPEQSTIGKGKHRK